MAVDKKFFVDINLQGNALNNATIGSNSDMTKAGSFRFDGTRLEYYDGISTQSVANLADISAVTGGLILQGGYDAATNTPDIADGTALKGFFWVVTEAGSFLGESVQVGDSLVATVDNAYPQISQWLILQGNVVIASDTVDGIVRLATQAEVDAGTEGGAVVLTPATFENSTQLAGIRGDITKLQNEKLNLFGGTMQGDIDMDGNAIVNVPTPTDSGDAANKQYVDDQAAAAQSNAEATASADATTKADAAQAAAESYADGLAVNYDAAGSAATAETNAKAYADSLAPNYDAAGSAATAETNAKVAAFSYTDSAISQEVTDRNSAIATAKGEAIADSNSYTDGAIAQEVIDRDAAIATAKSEAIADANSYTDTQIAAQSFSSSFADTAWTESGGVYTLSVAHNVNTSTPKVASYVSSNLVEFAVVVIDANTIELKSNIAAPASVNVGVSK